VQVVSLIYPHISPSSSLGDKAFKRRWSFGTNWKYQRGQLEGVNMRLQHCILFFNSLVDNEIIGSLDNKLGESNLCGKIQLAQDQQDNKLVTSK
jgi:hypothetical protein